MAEHSLQDDKIETGNLQETFKDDDHPVSKYLRSLVWDGVPRLHNIASGSVVGT